VREKDLAGVNSEGPGEKDIGKQTNGRQPQSQRNKVRKETVKNRGPRNSRKNTSSKVLSTWTRRKLSGLTSPAPRTSARLTLGKKKAANEEEEGRARASPPGPLLRKVVLGIDKEQGGASKDRIKE